MQHHHHRLALVPLAALAAAFAPLAQAETGPYYIGGLVAYSHQSNVLGLADGQDVSSTPGYVSKSDNITSLALVGGVNQTVGRQRVFGDVTLRNNRYSRNELLDNNSYALTAGVDWETVNNLSGNVTLKTNRDLFTFTAFDRPTANKNLVTSRQADAVARLGGVTRLTFEAGAGYRSVDYSDVSYDSRDNRQTYWSLGTRYIPSQGARVGLTYRDTSGKYPRLGTTGTGEVISDKLDRQDVDLTGFLELSGLTTLSARATYSRIDYERQTDFSGFTGMFKATYVPTAKLRLSAEVARDRGQDLRFVLDSNPFFGTTEAETANLVTALRARADYELTGKVQVNANLGYTRRPVTVFNNTLQLTAEGRETSRQFGIGASWTPTRTSRVGCDLSRQKRSSDLVTQLNVSSDGISCYAQLTLQP